MSQMRLFLYLKRWWPLKGKRSKVFLIGSQKLVYIFFLYISLWLLYYFYNIMFSKMSWFAAYIFLSCVHMIKIWHSQNFMIFIISIYTLIIQQKLIIDLAKLYFSFNSSPILLIIATWSFQLLKRALLRLS